ncbi:MAG: VTT domain-containing protein [Candidatus Daviesbacteria bacterium]|nr:VTT domain-containing protein [Candidatus Daviesbacteria bacterium]
MRYEINWHSVRGKLNRKYAIESALLLIIFIVGYILLSKVGLYLQDPSIKEFIINAGILGPLVFSILYIITMIIAPLPGFPLLITAFGVFGIYQTILLNYFLCLISASMNFYIARKWGRGAILHLVGKHGLDRVDGHVNEFGTEILILTRLFDGFLYEWISYAAGLTKMSFKRYFIITAICSIPYNLVALYFAQRVSDLGQLFISLSIVFYVTLSLPFLYVISKKLFLHARKHYFTTRAKKL